VRSDPPAFDLVLPTVFQEQLKTSSQVYPCTVEELQTQLTRFSRADLVGLSSVGLTPQTNQDRLTNARYFFGQEGRIVIYSYPFDLTVKLPTSIRRAHITQGFSTELSFGMKVESVGARQICRWDDDDLRRFILEHVLPHEIGHHVYHRQRMERGYEFQPGTAASEQFAESYALRFRRQMIGS
jgi:hypothetical protein